MTGHELISEIVRFIRRYCVVSEAQALTVALWALNTWVYERFNAVPYLEIWATHKRGGKSTLAECLSMLSRGGRTLATVRTLQMVRLIEATDGAYVPFIDEAERFWQGTLGDDRAILATGYQRGAVHEIEQKGSVAQYRTFSPKAFMLIGNLHDVIRDRCISIKLERAVPAASLTTEHEAAKLEANALVKRWQTMLATATTSMDVIPTEAEPRFKVIDPVWLTNPRDRQIWLPLFTLAGAMKLHKADIELLQRASVDLSVLKTLPPVRYHQIQEEQLADDTPAVEALVRDVWSVLRDDEKAVATVDLLERLYAIPIAPWRSFGINGLSAAQLSDMLARYAVKPTAIRFGKSKKGDNTNVMKGYKAAELRAIKL